MQRLRFLTIMATLLLIATTQVSAQKSDEAAIKKVIQQESSTYFHKDYDGWAQTMAHDSADVIVRVDPSGHYQLLGWNAISAMYKKDIQDRNVMSEADITPLVQKTDYDIKINGDRASASFKNGKQHSDELRTLIKQNGSWKILCITTINSAAYAMEQTMGNMETFVGKWVLDGKPTTEPADEVQLNAAEFDLRKTPIGLEQLSSVIFTNKNGQSYAPPAGQEYFIPDYNTNTISYTSIRKNRFGQTFTNTGKITSDKMNSFTVTTMYPDKPDAIQSEYTVTLKDGKWHQVDKDFNKDGKQVFTSTVDMRRVNE